MVMKYKLIVFLIVPVVMGISVAARASQPNLMTIKASMNWVEVQASSATRQYAFCNRAPSRSLRTTTST